MDTPITSDFFELAPDAMILMAPSGEIIRANGLALDLFGYSSAELLALRFETLIPEGLPRYEQLQKAAKGGHVDALGRQAIETTGRRKDGSEFIADTRLSFIDFKGSRAVAVAVRDVSDSRQTLQQLRDSQEYNRGLIESNIDALMTTDPLGIITDVNRMMCEMTG